MCYQRKYVFNFVILAASAPVAMDHSDDGGDASSTHSASEVSSEASSSSRPSFSLRDQSPLKEAILTKVGVFQLMIFYNF